MTYKTMPIVDTRKQLIDEANLQKLVSVNNLFQYCVHTKGISGAIVLIKSTTTKTLQLKFAFDLTNLTAEQAELTVKPNESGSIVLMPVVLGEPIGVGVEINY